MLLHRISFLRMNILDFTINCWIKIKSLGSGDDPKKNANIALLNQIAFTSSMVAYSMVILAIYINLNNFYSILTFILGSFSFSILIFNYFNRFHVSRFIIAGIFPQLIALYIVLIGGSFGEESILTVLLFLIYILYENAPKQRAWFYISLGASYISASFFLLLNPPLVTKIDNPYDNIFSFIVCVIWLVMVIWLYQKKIRNQQNHQERLLDEMTEKNNRLQKTTDELEQFTYIASHDLKSPLRTIISFLDLIKRDVTRERYDDLLSKLDFARSGAKQMNFLVTDILEYSEITKGKVKKKSIVSLQSIIEKVNFNLMDVIKKRKADLYVFSLPDFYCNETEMIVLFQNFIENGIKYNKETTPNIFVKAKLDDKYLTLQFIDNGIGIEEEYFNKIFLLFKRLHTSESYSGTGLGLGLCKKIIDDMGGTVSVESTVNVGSTFTILLPVNQEHQASQQEINSEQYS